MKTFFTLLCFLVFFVSTCLLVISLWIVHSFGNVRLDQILANAVQPLDGVAIGLVVVGVLFVGALGLSIFCGISFVVRRYFRRFQVFLFLGLSALFLVFPCYQWDLHHFVVSKMTYSDIYEKEYVLPQIKAESRNLIFIVLESYEKSFQDDAVFQENLSPFLTQLQKEGLTPKGYHQLEVSNWTITSIMSSLCGAPLKVDGFIFDVSMFREFFPNMVCWPQLLAEQGYQNYLMKAATIQFTGTDKFAIQHGFKEAVGYRELRGVYGSEDQDPWGLNDHQIFQASKDKLSKISQENNPFFFMVVQAGTHQPNGYVNKNCVKKYTDYKDAALCTDKEVADFIAWIKQQPFYDNTTVVIAGDHFLYASSIDDELEKIKEREIYLTFLNSATSKKLQPHIFTTLDLAPTILEAMGVVFEGQFGMGRSLFRQEKTLIEKYGPNLNFLLSCLSHKYASFGSRLKKSFFIAPEELPEIALNETIDFLIDFDRKFGVSKMSEAVLGQIWTEQDEGSIKIKVPQVVEGLWLDFDLFVPAFSSASSKTVEVHVNNILLDTWFFDGKRQQKTVVFIPQNLILESGILQIDFKIAVPQDRKGYQGIRFNKLTIHQ